MLPKELTPESHSRGLRAAQRNGTKDRVSCSPQVSSQRPGPEVHLPSSQRTSHMASPLLCIPPREDRPPGAWLPARVLGSDPPTHQLAPRRAGPGWTGRCVAAERTMTSHGPGWALLTSLPPQLNAVPGLLLQSVNGTPSTGSSPGGLPRPPSPTGTRPPLWPVSHSTLPTKIPDGFCHTWMEARSSRSCRPAQQAPLSGRRAPAK